MTTWLTTGEVALKWGVSDRTVRNYIYRGTLPAERTRGKKRAGDYRINEIHVMPSKQDQQRWSALRSLSDYLRQNKAALAGELDDLYWIGHSNAVKILERMALAIENTLTSENPETAWILSRYNQRATPPPAKPKKVVQMPALKGSFHNR